MSNSISDSVEGSGSAVRLIVEYDGDRLSLVSQQRVDMQVTALSVGPRAGLTPGTYAQVRGAAGEALADVAIPEALSTSLEVFPEDPDAPITRTDVEHPSGAFTVVVPAARAAREVAIIRVPPPVQDRAAPGAAAQAGPNEDLATFILDPES
jgi:hypothetical protein